MTQHLSIIIPTWRNYRQLSDLIKSIQEEIPKCTYPVEIVIVDDTPLAQRKSIPLQPNMKVLTTSGNTRFAKASNTGFAAASGEFILFLNDDILVLPNAIQNLMEKAHTSGEICIAPQLLLPNGTIQPSARNLPTYQSFFLHFLPFPANNRDIKLKNFDYSKEQYVEQPYFSAILFSRAVLDKIGFIDPLYPHHFTDVDWAKRAHDAGQKILYYPESKFIHHHGVSGDKLGLRKDWLWIIGLYRYFGKYHSNSLYKRIANMFLLPLIGIAKIIQGSIREINRFAHKGISVTKGLS